VHDLGDRPGTDPAGVNDALGNRIEQRTGPLEHAWLTARHDQQIARLRAFHAAAHRRV
jgi:hypothetical protein